MYRYFPGAVYRPHVDGAWPASGKDADGNYVYDSKGGAVRSRFTALIYLNEGFSGGHTTFFTPSSEPGVVESRGVAPREGAALFFPHGGTEGSLVRTFPNGSASNCSYFLLMKCLSLDCAHRYMKEVLYFQERSTSFERTCFTPFYSAEEPPMITANDSLGWFLRHPHAWSKKLALVPVHRSSDARMHGWRECLRRIDRAIWLPFY
jgi:hypothetical protein